MLLKHEKPFAGLKGANQSSSYTILIISGPEIHPPQKPQYNFHRTFIFNTPGAGFSLFILGKSAKSARSKCISIRTSFTCLCVKQDRKLIWRSGYDDLGFMARLTLFPLLCPATIFFCFCGFKSVAGFMGSEFLRNENTILPWGKRELHEGRKHIKTAEILMIIFRKC